MDLVPGEIRVIAVGSPLCGDDGVGAVILDQLRGRPWPQRVRLIDGGTGGIDLLGLMDGAGQVILVDAVDMGRAAGELARFNLQEVRLADENGRSLSLHQAGLAEVLALGRDLGILPPLVIFGIQPQQVDIGAELSPDIAAAVQPAVQAICAEVENCLGI